VWSSLEQVPLGVIQRQRLQLRLPRLLHRGRPERRRRIQLRALSAARGLEEQGLSASLRTRTVRSSTPAPAMPGPTRTSSPPTSSSTSSPRDVTKRTSSGPCNACGVTTSTAESGPPAGVASHVPGHSGRPGVRRGPLPTITWWCPRVSPTTRSAPLVRVRVRWRAARQITGPERRRPSANRISRDRRLVGRLRSHRFGLRRSVLCARPEHGRLRRRGRREACCRTQPRTRRPAP
jgi:hypothetical protein